MILSDQEVSYQQFLKSHRQITIILKHIILKSFLILFFLSGCENSEKEIMVTIKTIDVFTKKPRVNDTIEIRMGKPSFPMRRYIKIGKCRYTDSLGEVKIKLFKNERYYFTSCGVNPMFRSKEFAEGELKNNERIIIEVNPRNILPPLEVSDCW